MTTVNAIIAITLPTTGSRALKQALFMFVSEWMTMRTVPACGTDWWAAEVTPGEFGVTDS